MAFVRSPRTVFYDVVNAAINDLLEHGYDSQERLDRWLEKIHAAARSALIPESVLVRTLQESLGRVYQRQVKLGKMNQVKPGVSQFTLDMIKPSLRAELDRRILASSNLIRLNREASIARTLQRFAGWATTVPAGGTDIVKRKELKDTVRKGIAALPFEERRVIVDQGHKLVNAVNTIVAVDGGAIAATWRHVNESGGYQARPAHEARDGRVYLLRGSWAHRDGLVKPSVGFTDDVEQPAELPFCRCQWVFAFTLRDLPDAMLTAKGKLALSEARAKLRRVS